MITRLSTLFLRTLREDPADAEVPSHKLLVRAGYVRRVAPGIYSWLPLGLRVLRNIETVVREEMDAIGAQEIHFPALLPREPYEATGRWTEYGPNVFRLRDRKGADYLLGPTHEELFTLTVKGEFSSYKDYPVILYQIQTKYRDEERPRAGILRGREFLMKDSYSFDLSDEGLAESYRRHREAYIRIFDRLGLRYVIVSAMSGAMGGSASEEFLAEAETGEDTFVRSLESGYAANVEAVTTPAPPERPFDDLPEAKVLHTPDTPTIETLVDHLNQAGLGRTFTAADTLKNVMVKTRQPGAQQWELLGVGVPGDREVDLKRLEASLSPAEVALLDEADFTAYPFLAKGYIGPGALHENGVRYLVDPRVVRGTAWATGADQPDHHVVGLVCGRDFTPDGTVEAAEVRAGDPSPDGTGTLAAARGIEIGHIFQLGRKYADAFGLDALGADGKPIRITMGCYGIGVSRLVGAITEQSHDEHGLIWPRAVAPADVHVVAAGKSEQITDAAERLAGGLDAAGLRVMLDDRNATAGVKFADAELIGVPTIVV
ncbi:MAG TPA: proline--tRNA ligase, partial [Pseudonocardiaceae bacterium]|nr:proline--tRNA ligase [Pseudonocardiaceae bacterium]